MSGGLLHKVFGRKNYHNFSVLKTDMHSHLIPGIDDGSISIPETIEMISGLSELGYSRFITTPHIHPEFFENTEDSIRSAFENLQNELSRNNIDVQIEIAAEYYVDELFADKLNSGRNFLTLKNDHLLLEVSMVSEFRDLSKVIFELMMKGYKIILAHAERYPYLYIGNKLHEFRALRDKEVFLQVNIRSFTGAYGEIQKKIARHLADENMIDYLGTDIHRPMQLPSLEAALYDEHIQTLLAQNHLLNHTL